jgi:hypothetical protein
MSRLLKLVINLQKELDGQNRQFLMPQHYRWLKAAYLLLRYGHHPAKYDRAVQHLRNAWLLGPAQFFLVAASCSIAKLIRAKQDALFPELGIWFNDHPPSNMLRLLAGRQIRLVQRDIDFDALGTCKMV